MVTCVLDTSIISIQTNVNLTPHISGYGQTDTLILEWIRLKPYIDTLRWEREQNHRIQLNLANNWSEQINTHIGYLQSWHGALATHLARKSFTRPLNKRYHIANLHFLSSSKRESNQLRARIEIADKTNQRIITTYEYTHTKHRTLHWKSK